MKKLKNVLTTLLTVALTAALAIGGTLAYLTTDAGDEKNVFSVGNIDVSLDEEVGIYGEGGEVKENEDGAEYIEIMPGDYLKKEVTVTNNGKTDAYVAVTVTLKNEAHNAGDLINQAIDKYYETKLGESDETDKYVYDMYNNVFDGWGMNYYHDNEYGYDARNTITKGDTYNADWADHVLKVDFTETMDDYWLYSIGNWFKSEHEAEMKDYSAGYGVSFDAGYYTKNMDQYELCYTYYLLLPAGESSTLFNGLNVPAEFNADQLAMFDGLEINVEAKAIQADNMAVAEQYANDEEYGKAKTAFAILAGDIEVPEDYTNKPNTVKVEGNDKTALMNAINNAEAGDIVLLTENVTVAGYAAAEKLTIEKAIVLDLDGYTLTTECGWGGIDAKGGCSIKNGTINHTGNTAAIKAFQVDSIQNVTINVTPTEGKVKGGIVVQEGAGCYVRSIKNVTITGATNGIETYRCGNRSDYAIGSMENVTIDAIDTGLLLSAPVGTATNCNIEGDGIGINMYLYGPYSVSLELVNSKVSGNTGIYAHDEVGKTNPGSLTLTCDDETVITGSVTQEFEEEVAGRVTITVPSTN